MESNWRKFVVPYSLFVIFTWSILSSLDPVILLGGLLPALILLSIGVIGRKHGYLFIFVVLCVAILVNITSTKNPLLFPIALDGALTFSKEWTHIDDVGYGATFHQEEVTSACLSHFDVQSGLQSDTTYSVAVYRSVKHLDMIGLPYTEIGVWMPQYPSGLSKEVFYTGQDATDPEYYRQCVHYSKPLVTGWVAALHSMSSVILFSSYGVLAVTLVAIAIYSRRHRQTDIRTRALAVIGLIVLYVFALIALELYLEWRAKWISMEPTRNMRSAFEEISDDSTKTQVLQTLTKFDLDQYVSDPGNMTWSYTPNIEVCFTDCIRIDDPRIDGALGYCFFDGRLMQKYGRIPGRLENHITDFESSKAAQAHLPECNGGYSSTCTQKRSYEPLPSGAAFCNQRI